MSTPWKAMRELVDETISEIDHICQEYPYSEIGEWFGNDEFHARTIIKHRERKIFAEMARYFKAHPDQLERWSNMYNK